MHEVGLQVGHGVCQFRELWLQRVDRRLRIPCTMYTRPVTVRVPDG